MESNKVNESLILEGMLSEYERPYQTIEEFKDHLKCAIFAGCNYIEYNESKDIITLYTTYNDSKKLLPYNLKLDRVFYTTSLLCVVDNVINYDEPANLGVVTYAVLKNRRK